MWHDDDYMRVAIRLGMRNLGNTAENPSVGCVIVRDGQMIAQGWTQAGGRPHAERHALLSLDDPALARDATVYVTLEPCAHTGKTPPCTQALIDAGVSRVVIGAGDPDTRVSGNGIAQLEAAGIRVTQGGCHEAAATLHAGFFRRISQGLPEVTVKIATSDNETVTTGDAAQPWITGVQARQTGQLLRARHDAIITGIGTVLADDPMLTCRLPGLEARSPVRVVLDSALRLPLDSALVRTAADVPVWAMTTADASGSERAAALAARGVRCIPLRAAVSWPAALTFLAGEGINRVMVEGGAQVTTSALESGLATWLAWFRAPHSISDPHAIRATPGKRSLRDYADDAACAHTALCGVDQFAIYRL